MLIRHNSFSGHLKVVNLLSLTNKFELISHEENIYRSDGSTFAQPDLVFRYQDRPIYVEVKTDQKGNRSILNKQCLKLANMKGKKTVLGFLYNKESNRVSLHVGYGYQWNEIKDSLSRIGI